MYFESATAIVLAWQEAANRQDIARLLALSATDIAIVGPRGAGHGHQLLREWVERAGIHLDTRRVFARGEGVVMAQHATWRVTSRFRVAECRVALIARHDRLDAALAEAGLTEVDAVPHE